MKGNDLFPVATGYLTEKTDRLQRTVDRIVARGGEATLLELGELVELSMVIRNEAQEWYDRRCDEIEGAPV